VVTETDLELADGRTLHVYDTRTNDADRADLVDSVLAENVVQHISGMPPEARSLEGFKQLLPTLRQAFPDTVFEVQDVVAEADKVAFGLIWMLPIKANYSVSLRPAIGRR